MNQALINFAVMLAPIWIMLAYLIVEAVVKRLTS
jgi:hypothetical protein